MRSIYLTACAALLFAVGPVEQIRASQMAGHIYAALEARQKVTDAELRKLLEKEEAAYIAGAMAPDIANTAHYAQLKLGQLPPGTESHLEKTGQIVENLLKHAANDREKAFALGWLTHHQVDSVIHPLVNRYGGYYLLDKERHMALEMVETEHAYRAAKNAGHSLDAYALKLTTERANDNVAAELVVKAFHETFPNGPHAAAYKPTIIGFPGSAPLRTEPAAFLGHYVLNADNVRSFTEANLATHRGETQWPYGGTLTRLAGGPPPMPEEYDELTTPIEITGVEYDSQNAFVNVRVRINNSRLYELFLQDWDRDISKAIVNAAGEINKWNAAPSEYRLANTNLDEGPDGYDKNNAEQNWPGNPGCLWLKAEVKIYSKVGRSLKLVKTDNKTFWDDSGKAWIPGCDATEASVKAHSEALAANYQWGASRKIWGEPSYEGSLRIAFVADHPGPYTSSVSLELADRKTEKSYGGMATFTDVRTMVPELTLREMVPTKNVTCFPLRPRLEQQVKKSNLFGGLFGGNSEQTDVQLYPQDAILNIELGTQARYYHLVKTSPQTSETPSVRDLSIPWFSGLSPGKHQVRATVHLADAHPQSLNFEIEVTTRALLQGDSPQSVAAPRSTPGVRSGGPAKSPFGGENSLQRREKFYVEAKAKNDGSLATVTRWATETSALAFERLDHAAATPADVQPLIAEAYQATQRILTASGDERGEREAHYASQMANLISLCNRLGDVRAYEMARTYEQEMRAKLKSDDWLRNTTGESVYQSLANLALISSNDIPSAIEYTRSWNQVRRELQRPVSSAEEAEWFAALERLKRIEASAP